MACEEERKVCLSFLRRRMFKNFFDGLTLHAELPPVFIKSVICRSERENVFISSLTRIENGVSISIKIMKSAIIFTLCILAFSGCASVKENHMKEDRNSAARRGEEIFGDIIWRVETNKKVVALTLDDGPDPKYTPKVLKLAREKHIKLTFFLVGREIELHPELARQEVAAGHVIGNHTWDHTVMKLLDEGHDVMEIEKCEKEIEKICGRRTHLFRPPKGLWDGDTFLAAAESGYRMILWSVALEHHAAKTPEEMAQRVLKKVRPGMIILAHDGEPCHPVNRGKTMKALPLLVDGLLKEGYSFVTVPELLELAGNKTQGK